MYKLILFTCFSTTLLFAQEEKPQKTPYAFNRWSIDGGIGLNNAITPFSKGYSNNYLNPLNVNAGARYMFNNKIGVKADFGFDKISDGKNSLAFNSRYIRFSFQGVTNLASILKFNTFSSKLGLLAHGGIGVASMTGEKFVFPKGSDEMWHLIFGVTPQYKVNEKLALNLDFTILQNYKQHYAFDYKSQNPEGKRKGTLGNITVGFSYKLGTADRHLDWVFDQDNTPAVQDLTVVEDKVKAIEEGLKDDDKDGVYNMYDIEPTTPEGVKVDTRGKQIIEEVVVVEVVKDTTTSVVSSNPTTNNTSNTANQNFKSINGMNGLFFTVQVGAYDHYNHNPKFDKIKELFQIKLPEGRVRFCTGVLRNEVDGVKLMNNMKALGITDAFLTAYYHGERITVSKARMLLKKYGKTIIDPAAK